MRSQEQVGVSPHCARRVRWGCGAFQTVFPREQDEAERNVEEREAQVVYTRGDRWAVQALEDLAVNQPCACRIPWLPLHTVLPVLGTCPGKCQSTLTAVALGSGR